MDITETTAPRSDQQNFDDYATASKTVTVEEVKKGTVEQPVEVHLVEFPGRPFKPSKSMRRVLVACWGPEASEWVGRRMTLFGDPTIKFGKDTVGGIRIAAVSHIDEAKTIPLTVTRGRRAPFTVEPLPDATGIHLAALTGATTLDELQIAWAVATKAGVSRDAGLVALKDARKVELSKPAEPVEVVESDPALIGIEDERP